MKKQSIGFEILICGLALFLVLPFCMVSRDTRELVYHCMRLLVPLGDFPEMV